MRSDQLATEEPLEMRLLTEEAGLIRLEGRGSVPAPTACRTIAITMCTPGDDLALAAGFLHGERIVRTRGDIRRVSFCQERPLEVEWRENVVNVKLRPGLKPDLESLERHFYTTSACGVCGKASLDASRLCDRPSRADDCSRDPLWPCQEAAGGPGDLRRDRRWTPKTGH